MAGAITNTLRPAGDDGYFALEIGRIVKVESLAFWDLFVCALQKVWDQNVLSKTCRSASMAFELIERKKRSYPNTHILSNSLLDGVHGFWERFANV